MTPPGPPGGRLGEDPRAEGGSGVLAVLLAGGRGRRLFDLTEREAKPALFMAGRRRLVDFALQEVARAGLPRALVLTGWRPGTLEHHLGEAWEGRADGPALEVLDGGTTGTAEALRRAAPAIDAHAPRAVVAISAGRAGAFDLPALLAAHRAGGGAATALALPAGAPLAGEGPRLSLGPGGQVLATGEGEWVEGGAVALDWAWARDRLAASGPDLAADLLPLALAEGALHAAPEPSALWRDAATPDAFRRAWVELQAGVPFPLPPERGPAEASLGPTDLIVEAGGLTLTVPRFGARRAGRWTLIEDSAVMPGARVAPGARLIRALVAPGAIVPSGLVAGEDAEEDARWFRLCQGPKGGSEVEPPTVLVTAPMLARRAAERMRAHAVATPGPLPHDAPEPPRRAPLASLDTE